MSQARTALTPDAIFSSGTGGLIRLTVLATPTPTPTNGSRLSVVCNR